MAERKTVKAYVLTRYGGPEVAQLRDIEIPDLGRHDVLVQVRAAGLNPVDFKTRQGMLRVVQRYRLPVVLGNELAGVVERCGSGVTRFKPGDRVFARVPKERMGAFAEFAAVPEDVLAAIPATLDFETAAAALSRKTWCTPIARAIVGPCCPSRIPAIASRLR